MLSNIKFTAPQYIAEDKEVTIQVSSIKNGIQSDPIEFTLTAQAIAPVAPDYAGSELTGSPNTFLEFDVNSEPNTTIEIVSCTNGKATANGTAIKLTLDDLDADGEGTLIIKAKRGKFESAETEIAFKVLITEPQAPVVDGPSEVNENQVAEFTAEIESDCELTANADEGTCSVSDGKVYFTAPEVASDKSVDITFTSTRKSKTASTTQSILVKNVLAPSAKLELVDNQTLRILKDSELVIAFKNASGTLAVSNTSEFYGTAVVEGSTIKVTGANAGTINLSVTQTEADKAVSEALSIEVVVYEISDKLIASSANETKVEVDKTIDLAFENANGTISAQAKNEYIEVAVVGSAVQVKGLSEGTGTLEVTQTQENKEPSEALAINIVVEAAQVEEPEKSAQLELAESQATETTADTPLDIAFANLTGTLAAEITSGSEFGSIQVDSDKITLTPSGEGTIVISATQTEAGKSVSDALEISVTITATSTEG